MKTPKPQPVTIRPYGGRFNRSMFAENGSGTARMLYDIAIYDAAGIVCYIDYYSFSKLPDATEAEHVKMNIPITWKTYQKPDYTEPRAHFVAHNDAGTRKYVLLIPAEAVTVTKGNRVISRPIAQVEQLYTVEGIPATFSATIVHPFDRYAIVNELEELQKHAYTIFTADEITKPHNRERIAQFVARLEEYQAEAERIQTESADEYLQECSAENPRFDFVGHFQRIANA